MCLALEEVHANDVMHKKFDPSHVMIEKDTNIVKVIGFSALHEMNHEGSVVYDSTDKVAPFEVIDGKGKTQAADVWALGIMLYTMCNGNFPFKNINDVEENKKFITSGDFLEMDGISNKSETIKRVLKGALTETPDARMSIVQLRGLLKDEVEQELKRAEFIKAFEHSSMNRLLLDEKYDLYKLVVSEEQA